MIFNSIPFLIFILLFIPVFYILRGRKRLWFTLISSCIFYGWWDWRFLSLIAISTLVDYFIGKRLISLDDNRKRKLLLVISLVVNLGLLGFFKYFNFFIESFNDLLSQIGLEPSTKVLNIILPVGISFYTFQTLSYTIDAYYRKIVVEKDLLKFANYVSFFPQLVAGPIVRASDFLPQLHNTTRKPKINDLLRGLDLVVLGYIKKVLIADSLAPIVESAFNQPLSATSLQLIIGIIFYSFQIYCDFSGYSDIAIGFARMLGFRFPVNFNLPYFSRSFSEFWTRWHISLSSWLRDYLYIPLGGNRNGKFNTYKNLFITMLLGGLWHGANWTFIFWGGLHGFYLIVQRLITKIHVLINSNNRLVYYFKESFSILIVYILTCFAWIFFRAHNFENASAYITGILSFENLDFNSVVNKFWIAKGVLLICLLILGELLSIKVNYTRIFLKYPMMRIAFYSTAIWIISFLGTFSDNQFIYFQF